MKNLLTFVHPSKQFRNADYHKEIEFLVKFQIDNSLAYGWKRQDIIIATNFDYSYNGVKSLVVTDGTFNSKKHTVSKIQVILKLYKMGLINDELFWFHDFDAFQNAPLGEVSLGDKDLALTHTSGDDNRWSTGVLFFSQKAKDIFIEILKECHRRGVDEERAIMLVLRKNKKIEERFLTLNLSYNFAIRKRNVANNYLLSDIPIKVLHFHPFDKRPSNFATSEIGKTNLEVVYGNNSFGKILISDKTNKIFRQHRLHRHGIK